ncbi:putative aminopeptidase [Blastococcus saxobsidens]|uniref:Putative aminopeptidase n=1 Tax=Blastococcus saxobsidens (strain DD2) TaxID=1146883 RepID=H6RSC5_BLASD|nr:putative aminopeptidase [Blastococcus saxobsidens]CCG05517.1 Putative aminopeptidase [Blastococcus saxobsidens DD2]
MDRSRRSLVDVGDFVGSYFLDDRSALTAVIAAARQLRRGGRPPADTYLVCTTGEEMGGIGASYASRALPGDVTLALDIGPAEAEYQVAIEDGPVIVYADDYVVYDKVVADHLLALGRELDLAPQSAVYESFGSDGSQAKSKGQTPLAGLVSLPTLSTHGYEVQHRDAVDRCARLVAEYLRRPTPGS